MVTANVLSSIPESEGLEGDVPDFRSEPDEDTLPAQPVVDPAFFDIPLSVPRSFGPSIEVDNNPTLLRNLPPPIVHLQARMSHPILEGDFACECNLALFPKRGCKRGSEYQVSQSFVDCGAPFSLQDS